MKCPVLLLAIFLLLPLSLAAQDNSFAPGSAVALGDATDPERERFVAYLDGVMAAQFNDFELAGVSLSIVRDGQPYISRGYGFANVETKESVDPGVHLFRPGSISKLFTWTAVMQLMEQGLLDLDTDINQYLTQFEIPDTFEQSITLKHIMTHTAGFEDGGFGYLFADSPDDLRPLAEVLETYRPERVREPGVYSAYSNYATALAGLIVANVSGVPFEEYMARNIFAPLDMNNSTFDEPLPEHLASSMAVGYANNSGGLEAAGFEFIKNFGPAGALSASADDMAKFMMAHVSDGAYNGNRILRAETAQQMHSRLFAHHPAVAGMAYGFYEIHRNGTRFVGHGGDTLAFHSELVIRPEDGFGLYLSFNSPEGAQARAGVVNAILDYFYPGPDPDYVFPELEGNAERIANVAGAYRVNRRSYTKLEGLTSILGDITNAPGGEGDLVNPLGRFYEIEPYVFQRQGGYETIVFEVDEQGDVSRAYLSAVPIMVLDKVPLLEQGRIHLMVIALSLFAAVFVLINAIRNRDSSTAEGIAVIARGSLVSASGVLLLFVVVTAIVLARTQVDTIIYDFPPGGTALALVLPILFTLLAVACGVLLLPVWRSASCNLWQRIRYTYVGVLFLALALVMNYWNLLGWQYY